MAAERIMVDERDDTLDRIVVTKTDQVECDCCGDLAECKVNRRGEYYCSPSCRSKLGGGGFSRSRDLVDIFSSEFQRELAYQTIRFR